jgi:hypothetical protein
MITLIFAAMLVGLSHSPDYSNQGDPILEIVRSHGGSNGYDRVTERHEGNERSILHCANPGYADGEWTVVPYRYDQLHRESVEFAESQARSGVLQGSKRYTGLASRYTVQWYVSAAGDTVIRVFRGWHEQLR